MTCRSLAKPNAHHGRRQVGRRFAERTALARRHRSGEARAESYPSPPPVSRPGARRPGPARASSARAACAGRTSHSSMYPSVSPQGETGGNEATAKAPRQVKHDRGWSEFSMSETNRSRPGGSSSARRPLPRREAGLSPRPQPEPFGSRPGRHNSTNAEARSTDHPTHGDSRSRIDVRSSGVASQGAGRSLRPATVAERALSPEGSRGARLLAQQVATRDTPRS